MPGLVQGLNIKGWNTLERTGWTITNKQREHDDISTPAVPASLSTRTPALALLESGALLTPDRYLIDGN